MTLIKYKFDATKIQHFDNRFVCPARLLVRFTYIQDYLYINYQIDALIIILFVKYYSPLHDSSIKCSSSGGHSCIQVAYGTVTLYKSSWWPVYTQLAAYRQVTRNSYRE